MNLSLIIPAFNEERATGSIGERIIMVYQNVIFNNIVENVDIIAIDDGSSDKTAELAGSFNSIDVLSFSKNCGYGTAIKHGF